MNQTSSQRDVRPPHDPWSEIEFGGSESGCLSVYLSDNLSRLPVRAVTRPGDNKSDPNLETATFGLFSTCERDMRSSVVRRGIRNIFFVTKHGRGRVLSGWYRVRWYTDGVLAATNADFALAAEDMKFLDPAIPVAELPEVVTDKTMSKFRTFRHLSDPETAALLDVLAKLPDATSSYLEEIDRLERFNMHHTGYRHWNDTEPFSWRTARRYLNPSVTLSPSAMLKNTSPTGMWLCGACRRLVQNKSLLKECPICGAMGSLRPATSAEASSRGGGRL